MIIKELTIYARALQTSARENKKIFTPILSYVNNLADFDYSNLNKEGINELLIYAKNIKTFFKDYLEDEDEDEEDDDYYDDDEDEEDDEEENEPPLIIRQNEKTVKNILKQVKELSLLTRIQLNKEVEAFVKTNTKSSLNKRTVFIAHGRSNVWGVVAYHLKQDYGLNVEGYESESRTGESIDVVLDKMLAKASFAIIIFTAEDKTIDGKLHPRPNVVHELGLTQRQLKNENVAVMIQENVEIFSNISGLQYIPFKDNDVKASFYLLDLKLRKAGLIG
jgi:predicted nucleotide-binding protein